MNEIKQIISRLEKQRTGIERAIAALREVSEGASAGAPEPSPQKRGPKKRRLSKEGRERIAEAARRRWAALREAAGTAQESAKPVARKKRGRRKAAKTVAAA